MSKSHTELKIRAFSHASADEYVRGKKGEPLGQKKDAKRKEQDTTKGTQQKKSRPEDNQVSSLTSKPFTSRFNSYTLLSTSKEQILMQVEGRNLLRNLSPMRASVERRTMSKYCKFYKDKGHDTGNAFSFMTKLKH